MLKKILYGLAFLVVLGAIIVLYFAMNPDAAQRMLLKPGDSFDAATLPPPPDYTLPAAWAALPDREDMADVTVPGSGFEDRQADAQVDVFFIHPTTYFGTDSWNAAFDEGGQTRMFLERGVLRFQASVFNGSAKIYAPRYRQATLYSFLGEEKDGVEALELAYEDVTRAFEHFIDERNNHRPFILAGHSQGALHGMRLLQEKIAGTNLANRMVAAYLIGYSVPLDMGRDDLRPCRDPHSTGCYLNWNSVNEEADRSQWLERSKLWLGGKQMVMAGHTLTCVNPLTGTLNGAAPAEDNLGGLPFARETGAMPELRPQLTKAECDENGLLLVEPQDGTKDFSFGVFNGDYHIYDYNLFYANIRQDVDRRIGAFWKR
ncbi:DUF3089 domain-containing protein [Tepidicaulis sp. LMO-SS28]|uniref:DUF3089 domain-containing protein n=1 Tax=Tepidicaulis sp. LMO-SS28 TaxID=3447455 RepID=UPI003EDFD96D